MAKILVSNCSSAKWCQASAFQIQNNEAFRMILLELGLCYNVIYEQASVMRKDCNHQHPDLRQLSTFETATADEVSKDQDTLRERLEDLVHHNNSRSSTAMDQCLAKYLLERLNQMNQQSEGKNLDLLDAILWDHNKEPGWGWGPKAAFIGGGSGSSGVVRTEWLGIPCAKKDFIGEVDEVVFKKEAGILAHLNHPNIVKFLCCGIGAEQGDRFITMELINMSLQKLIAKTKCPIPVLVAVDIMVQIAHGMCYLHEKGIAHRDLKPLNIVLSDLASPLVNQFYVKLVDFGMSKTQVEVSKSSTITTPGMGTPGYRAPEVLRDANPSAKGKAYWFKADVFAFAVICAEILSPKKAKKCFEGIRQEDLYKELTMEGKRPEIPADCHEGLVSLIKECWATNPRSRPHFADICSRLEIVRHNLLREGDLKVPREDCQLSYSFIQKWLKERTSLVRVLDTEACVDENERRLDVILSEERTDLVTSSMNNQSQSISQENLDDHERNEHLVAKLASEVVGGPLVDFMHDDNQDQYFGIPAVNMHSTLTSIGEGPNADAASGDHVYSSRMESGLASPHFSMTPQFEIERSKINWSWLWTEVEERQYREHEESNLKAVEKLKKKLRS